MTLAPVVFLDTETTGLQVDADIWEFAGIRVDPGGQVTTLHTFIEHDSEKAAALPERFRKDLERRYNPELAVARNVAASEISWITSPRPGEAHPHIVGAVPSFDTERLARLLRHNDLTPSWHYHLIDVEVLALGWLLGRDVEDGRDVTRWGEHLGLPMRSDDLSRACGVEPPSEDDRHTAMGDVLWVKRWYEVLTRDTALQLPRVPIRAADLAGDRCPACSTPDPDGPRTADGTWCQACATEATEQSAAHIV